VIHNPDQPGVPLGATDMEDGRRVWATVNPDRRTTRWRRMKKDMEERRKENESTRT
jgi:hypothetical protein